MPAGTPIVFPGWGTLISARGNGGVALRATDGVGVGFRWDLLPTGRELGGMRTRGATIRGSEPLRVEIPEPEPEPEPELLLVARYFFF